MGKYVLLPDGSVKPEPDLLKWAKWFEETDRTIALDIVGNLRVSTVFLGIDHAFQEGVKPILFETMTFGDDLDRQQRYCTKEEALQGHAKLVAELRGEQ